MTCLCLKNHYIRGIFIPRNKIDQSKLGPIAIPIFLKESNDILQKCPITNKKRFLVVSDAYNTCIAIIVGIGELV